MSASQSASDHRYHHGNLRAALLDSALEVLTDRGVEGFSMREAARRAGVSQSAPKHHFGDTRGLLGALALRAHEELCLRLETADLRGLDVHERVQAIATRYVAFATEQPALFDLMWRISRFDADNPQLLEQKLRSLRALDRSVRGPEAPPAEPGAAALLRSYAVWSLVHGYVALESEGALDPDGNRMLLVAMLRLLALD